MLTNHCYASLYVLYDTFLYNISILRCILTYQFMFKRHRWEYPESIVVNKHLIVLPRLVRCCQQ